MMKKVSKMQICVWVLAVLPLLLTACVYRILPDRIPMQWGWGGDVRYDDKWQLWIVASMSVLFAVVFPLLPRLDPKRRNYEKFRDSYLVMQLFLMLLLLALVAISIIEALRPGTVAVTMVICILCSLLFIVLGNMMPKFRPNWFCGIKNPWTISSPTVWTRTHRLGGRLMFAAGLIGLVGAFVPNDIARCVLVFGPVMVAALVPTVMSYFWYRQEQA